MDSDIIDITELDSIDNVSEVNNTTLGAGIELLMNDKKKTSGKGLSSDIDIGDLENLEDELNDLSEPKRSLKEVRSDIFSSTPIKLNSDPIELNVDDLDSGPEPLNLGASTKNQSDEIHIFLTNVILCFLTLIQMLS